MIIGIASGKGGTGKTTIATNLAVALREPVHFLDCDVEEPNAHLFLKPAIQESLDFQVEVPEIDPARCTQCGSCRGFTANWEQFTDRNKKDPFTLKRV